MGSIPVRKNIQHTPPFPIDGAQYFVTICSKIRGTNTFLENSAQILDSARHRVVNRKWFVAILLIMPDHLHMIVSVPSNTTLTREIRNFKRYLASNSGLRFQNGYFDTRIRNAEHFAEKWYYIVNNPVAKGLIAEPGEWTHAIAFDRTSCKERLYSSCTMSPYHVDQGNTMFR